METTDRTCEELRGHLYAVCGLLSEEHYSEQQNSNSLAVSNAWLNDFRGSRDAWMACIGVYLGDDQVSPVIRHACLSLLIQKVKVDWTSELSPEERTACRERFREMYTRCLQEENTRDDVMQKQLSQLQVLCVETAEQLEELVRGGCMLYHHTDDETMRRAGIELLLAIPVELRHSSRSVHAGLVAEVKRLAVEVVLPMLEQTMAAQPEVEEDGMMMSGLICAYTKDCDIAVCKQTYPVLYSRLLGWCFGMGIGDAVEAVLNMLKKAYIDEDCVDERHRKVYVDIISKMKGCYAGEMSAHCAMAVAQVGGGLADAWPQGVAGDVGPLSVDLASMMLSCVRSLDCNVVESALEYFFAMDVTSVSERTEELRHPLLVELLQVLTRRLMYPLDAVSDEDIGFIRNDDDGGGGLLRLRKDIVPELLQEMFPVLGVTYLEWVAQGIDSASWQEAEISLYLLWAVSLQIRTRVLRNDGDSVASQMNALVCQGLMAMSQSLPGRCAGGGQKASVLSSTFSMTIETFSVLFGKVEQAPFEDAFRALLHVLSCTDAECQACVCAAIKALSVRSAERVAPYPERIHGIISSIGAAKMSLDGECKGDLVEAMVHLAQRLPRDAAQECIIRVLAPDIECIMKYSNMSGVMMNLEEDVTTLASSVDMVSVAFKAMLPFTLRHIDARSSVFLLECLNNPLSMLSHSSIWSCQPRIMDGVVQICKESIRSAGDASQAGDRILSISLPIVVHVFHTSMSATALETIAEMVESHFDSPERMNAICQASHDAFQGAFHILQQEGLEKRSTLVRTLLDVGYSFIVYAPNSMVQTGTLSVFVDLGIAALTSREVECITHALQFLCYLPSATNDESLDAPTAQIIDALIVQKSDEMIEALLYSLIEACPTVQRKRVAELIVTLMHHTGLQNQPREVLVASMSSQRIQSLLNNTTAREACTLLLEYFSRARHPQQHLQSYLDHFASVVRREQDIDILHQV